MMKKMSLLGAAFLLGLFVSITIHACGGDKEEVEKSGNGAAASSNMWNYGSGKIVKSYATDENGQDLVTEEYTYDSQNRVIGHKIYHYGSGVLRGRLNTEFKNYVYVDNICTYESHYHKYDSMTGAVIGTEITKWRVEYLL